MSMTGDPPPGPGSFPSGKAPENDPPQDLDACPRCGYSLRDIRWGQTNCPNCGLHFECC